MAKDTAPNRKLRTLHRLTALQVSNINQPGLHHDGGGLYLQVSKWETKSWVFRYRRDGRLRKMGLGSVRIVTLADARGRAQEARKIVASGSDPIEGHHAGRRARQEQAQKQKTFQQCAEEYIADHAPTWRNPKHAEQWPASLGKYVYPIMGSTPVASIDKAMVLKVLRPIWHDKVDTAKRIRGRIETVLDWAKVQDYRKGDNPARWKENLELILPRPSRVRKVRHQPALPYAEIPGFMADLRTRDSVSARALEFTVLTAMRTNAVIGAKWAEINLAEKIWVIPGERLKRKAEDLDKELVVPLPDRAIEILRNLPRDDYSEYVFLGLKVGQPLSNMTMLELLRGMRPGYVVHGFRSTFKDWASETTAHDNNAVEMALAHVIADKVEAAYRRGNLVPKRALLMADWAGFCMGRAAATMRAA